MAPAVALCIMTACGGISGGAGRNAAGWRTERVTLGDTTVVRTLGASAASADITLVQELSIGKLEGRDYEMFKELSHVTPTPSGDVLFFDSGAATVRRFDSSGVYLNSIGRRGSGPGEYSRPYRIDMMPDGTVLIEADKTLNRYHADGPLIVDRNILFRDIDSYGSQRAVTSDGLVHVSRAMHDSRYPDSTSASGGRLTATVTHRMRLDGDPVDTVFRPEPRLPPQRFEYRRQGARLPSYRAIPLAPLFITSYSTLGYWISGGDDTTYSITLHRREGGPLRIEADLERVPAQPDERQFHLNTLTYSVKRIDPTASPALALIPERKPHFRSITTDVDGRLWVQLWQPAVREAIDTTAESEPAGQGEVFFMEGVAAGVVYSTGFAPGTPRATERWVEPVVYDLFAPTGELLGRLRLPERARFGNARGDKVWLIVKDEYDVETLVRFHIAKPYSQP